MNPTITLVKIESIRSQLRLASFILSSSLTELALLDNSQTNELGAAIEKTDAVGVWLTTWQSTLERLLNEEGSHR